MWHPDGCRCSGCIPAPQVAIRQEYPSSGPPSTPQQRHRKPSPRKQSAGDWGIAIPAFLIIGLGWLVLCWPAIFAHGYTETGGWRWDIHSTYACAAWWGFLAVSSLLGWAGHRASKPVAAPPVKPASPGPPPRPQAAPACYCASCMAGVPCSGRMAVSPPGPPACRHLHAVPVDLSTGERAAYWCEQCETQLDESFGRFRRFCCGTEPGDPHWHSCPEVKVTS